MFAANAITWAAFSRAHEVKNLPSFSKWNFHEIQKSFAIILITVVCGGYAARYLFIEISILTNYNYRSESGNKS